MSIRERIKISKTRDGPHERLNRAYWQGFPTPKRTPWWSRHNAATDLVYDYAPWLLVFALGMVVYVEMGPRLFR